MSFSTTRSRWLVAAALAAMMMVTARPTLAMPARAEVRAEERAKGRRQGMRRLLRKVWTPAVKSTTCRLVITGMGLVSLVMGIQAMVKGQPGGNAAVGFAGGLLSQAISPDAKMSDALLFSAGAGIGLEMINDFKGIAPAKEFAGLVPLAASTFGVLMNITGGTRVVDWTLEKVRTRCAAPPTVERGGLPHID